MSENCPVCNSKNIGLKDKAVFLSGKTLSLAIECSNCKYKRIKEDFYVEDEYFEGYNYKYQNEVKS